ncbi:hypothetical protein BFF78_41640 [Streptomyces fodineus]|uniref:Tc1-like transposase DDE domain-containing protein n=1 Tax=Streptomyces fodineus TaxID=1904616 RepID=A0A1D7YME7_9ACTN|nr:hypothetical protein BFF78_41640 [Streptomyces fodineus]
MPPEAGTGRYGSGNASHSHTPNGSGTGHAGPAGVQVSPACGWAGNPNTHLAAGMGRYIAARDWLTVYQLTSYAPDLNTVEGIWSILRITPSDERPGFLSGYF